MLDCMVDEYSYGTTVCTPMRHTRTRTRTVLAVSYSARTDVLYPGICPMYEHSV